MHGTPWHFSETPARIGVAPQLGEHNDEVLGGLGYSEGADPQLQGAQGHLTRLNAASGHKQTVLPQEIEQIQQWHSENGGMFAFDAIEQLHARPSNR